MKQYDNANRGVLFYNNEKKNERGPDWSGNLNVDGKEYFFDAWTKQGRNGGEFLSVSIKPKEMQNKAPAPAPRRNAPGSAASYGSANGRHRRDDDDSDAPF